MSHAVRSLHICSMPYRYTATAENFVQRLPDAMYSFDDVPHSLLKSMHCPIRQAGLKKTRRRTWTATCQACDKCMSRPAWRLKSHKSFMNRLPPLLPSQPPKMYSPSAVADQAPTCFARAVGREPLGVIRCQALPCVAKKTGYHFRTMFILLCLDTCTEKGLDKQVERLWSLHRGSYSPRT